MFAWILPACDLITTPWPLATPCGRASWRGLCSWPCTLAPATFLPVHVLPLANAPRTAKPALAAALHPRSYAIGGPRAPACGILEDTGQLGAGSDDSGAGAEGAGAPLGEDSWRGITRDNNGRTAYWIALLYASLE